MRIAIDLMGGDNAPEAILQGINLFIEKMGEKGDKFFLCGIDKNFHTPIYQKILKLTGSKEVEIIPIIAPNFITMDDNPLAIKLTKRNSTINKAVLQLKNKNVDVIFSAGNSGATILTALDHLNKSAKYPGLLTMIPLPANDEYLFMMDVGASGNMAFKAELVESYYPQASLFYQKITKKENPRTGLLNVGIERKKGTKEHVKAYKYLEKSCPSFIGNIEGDRIFEGSCELLITGGFTGNIVLKILESAGVIIKSLTKKNFRKTKNPFADDKFSYENVGGAVLLGVEGNVVLGHGKSSPEATASALNFCRMIMNNIEYNSE